MSDAEQPLQLTGLQLDLVRVLWERGESSANDVHAALAGRRSLAPTTIATLLKRLEKRGVVERRVEGRQYFYSAAVSEEEAHRSMVEEVTDRLFEGDVPAMVNQLLRARDLVPGDLARIRALLEERERELDGA